MEISLRPVQEGWDITQIQIPIVTANNSSKKRERRFRIKQANDQKAAEVEEDIHEILERKLYNDIEEVRLDNANARYSNRNVAEAVIRSEGDEAMDELIDFDIHDEEDYTS